MANDAIPRNKKEGISIFLELPRKHDWRTTFSRFDSFISNIADLPETPNYQIEKRSCEPKPNATVLEENAWAPPSCCRLDAPPLEQQQSYLNTRT
jgi:hypothetical protein